MAIVIPGKLVYLATPHTGSKATHKALRSLEGALEAKMTHHAPKSDTQPFVAGNEVYVTTVRDPRDLVVTWYLRRKRIVELRRKRPISFKEFLQQVDSIMTYNHLNGGEMFWHDWDEVLRYECLQEDLNDLLDRLDLPHVFLEKVNVTEGKHPWPKYYDEETLKIVETRFKAEIEKFGY